MSNENTEYKNDEDDLPDHLEGLWIDEHGVVHEEEAAQRETSGR